MTQHLLMLNFISYLSAQAESFCRSSWSVWWSLGVDKSNSHLQIIKWCCECVEPGHLYKNRVVPRTKPCGTPDVTLHGVENEP